MYTLITLSHFKNYMYHCVTQGSCLRVFVAHENWVRSVFFHPSGKFIISSSDDKSIRIFDIKVRLLCILLQLYLDIFV